MILAGDVGGTKTALGLFRLDAGVPRLVREAELPSDDYPGLEPIVAAFLAAGAGSGEPFPTVQAACFGVAGPVAGNRAKVSNLPWEIDGPALARALGIPCLSLVNDLVATAEGIPLLGDDQVETLYAGRPEESGNQALIAAGTGLGMALLARAGAELVPVASEGGHMDFAPRDEEEIGLLRFLRERFGRASVERVVSGPGLRNLYDYLRERSGLAGNPAVHAAIDRGDDATRVIAEAGLAGDCGLCSRALDLFAAAYGAAAGNLALVGTATGGVFLGGGIAPKLLPLLRAGGFLRAFLAKGRFAGYMEKIPVRVVLDDRAALYGAARIAARLAAQAS